MGPAQAKLWARLGVCSVGAIITHKAVWAPDELAKWDGWEPSGALIWTKFFDSPEHATPWQEIGLAADLAAELCNRGWLPEQAQHHTSQALEAALSFAAPEDSIEHALSGLSYGEAWTPEIPGAPPLVLSLDMMI